MTRIDSATGFGGRSSAPLGELLNPILLPVKTTVFPIDPYDGQHPNCVEVVAEQDMLYCAAGRDGIIILDITDPTSSSFLGFVDVLDTPGVAMGVAFRNDPQTQARQMLVSDARCGLRLYQ